MSDGVDYLAFKIDPNTGLITTNALLDREKKDSYTLVLVVQDRGDPPQQTSRVLLIQVTDIDDHKPRFIRGSDDAPLILKILEEVPNNTFVGEIIAEDEDIGENAAIDYIITGKFVGGRTREQRYFSPFSNWRRGADNPLPLVRHC